MYFVFFFLLLYGCPQRSVSLVNSICLCKVVAARHKGAQIVARCPSPSPCVPVAKLTRRCRFAAELDLFEVIGGLRPAARLFAEPPAAASYQQTDHCYHHEQLDDGEASALLFLSPHSARRRHLGTGLPWPMHSDDYRMPARAETLRRCAQVPTYRSPGYRPPLTRQDAPTGARPWELAPNRNARTDKARCEGGTITRPRSQPNGRQGRSDGCSGRCPWQGVQRSSRRQPAAGVHGERATDCGWGRDRMELDRTARGCTPRGGQVRCQRTGHAIVPPIRERYATEESDNTVPAHEERMPASSITTQSSWNSCRSNIAESADRRNQNDDDRVEKVGRSGLAPADERRVTMRV